MSRLPVIDPGAVTRARLAHESAAQLRRSFRRILRAARSILRSGRRGPVGTLKRARAIVHGFTPAGNLRTGLSNPSKMPGRGWSLTALLSCPTGSSLASKPGTVCSHCYACRGRYTESGVAASLRARWDRVQDALLSIEAAALWCAAMARLIAAQSPAEFRWHDAGDLFSDRYLAMVLIVCDATPDTDHWIPTKETRRLYQLLVRRPVLSVPPNVTIRLSAPMLGRPMTVPPALHALGIRSSSSGWNDAPDQCPAPEQDGECRECRMCWDRSIDNSNYRIH